MLEPLTRVQSANEGRNSIYGFGEQNGHGARALGSRGELGDVEGGREGSSETHSRGHILSIPLHSFHFPPVP